MNTNTETLLTLARVRQIRPRETLWDREVRGFHARGNRDGSVSFILKTRVKGRQRKISLGKLGTLTVETARDLARDYAYAARKGLEPVARAPASTAPKFSDAISKFIEIYGVRLKPRTTEEYRRMLTRHALAHFKDKSIADITRDDVRSLHEKMGRTQRTANNVLTALSKLMTWSMERKWREDNPCKGIIRYKEKQRNRYLSSDEAQRLGKVLRQVAESGSETPHVIAALWLIIFTGARRNEVLMLKWRYVDLERRALNLPDSKTGPKTILLNRFAIDVLRNVPKVKGNPFVFVGQVDGRHLVNIAKPWKRIRTLAGLPDLRLHDLRHSFGNRAIDAGGSTRVLGVLLGHADEDTTQRYAHVSDSRALQLVDDTGRLIAESMNLGRPKAKFRFRRIRRPFTLGSRAIRTTAGT